MDNPFAPAAPPPQTMAHPAVQVSYDDDDILMDYDDPPLAAAAAAAADPDPADLAPEKVHLKGVDSMSTANVKAFVASHFTASPILKVEWIDDSSCCLVYRTPSEAAAALASLSLEGQELPPLQPRAAKLAASHPDSRLEVRVATVGDRKVAGARDRSRYYLFNPEEDRVEQAARLRRERDDSRRTRSTRRRTDDDDDHDYDRRHYDSREHDRRRTAAAADNYSDSFYDDASSRGVSRGRTSRDRSYSPRRRTRSRSPIELFPNRTRPSRELFPERAGDAGRLRAEPVELFSRRPAASSRFSVSPGPGPGPVELFPGRVAAAGPAKRSLEERINLDADREAGYRIKGRGGQAGGDDMFAQKLRAAKGEGLVLEEEEGRRRGAGGRRNRAEDMFG